MNQTIKRRIGGTTIVACLIFMFIFAIINNLPQYEIRTSSSAEKEILDDIGIAILVDWKLKKAMEDLISGMLPSIKHFKPMHIVLFSESDVSSDYQRRVRQVTNHTIHFILIEFNFPKDFDVNMPSPVKKSNRRSKWGYMHMCEFWFKHIWHNPLTQKFRYLMRFDTDSCFLNQKYKLEYNDSLVYLHGLFTWEGAYITDLRKHILDYVSKYNIEPKNPAMFKVIQDNPSKLPMYYNNIEIVKIAFMLKKEVQHFTDYMQATKGQFLYRWGDAPLRYATLALFSKPTEITALDLKGSYKHSCNGGY
ncbi:hypothetical protein KUTeg_018454 [Tegillarca granosa]|uniref:Uncharacterized protein n=1 Tax=Tegillarca granosa TaxID=220873 RepID=A0ABQ9ELW2_TEGGR|nr:hypothetical protein KUTeg_018454 [Tegillarca granosa]